MIKLVYDNKIAMVVPELGMNTCRLSFGEEEILRSPHSLQNLAAAPNVYGTPLLIPPNRVVGGRFAFEGVEYSLPINEPARNNHLHGFLSRASFDVIEQTENYVIGEFANVCAADGSRVVATGAAENLGATEEIFPFPYRIRVECKIDEEGYHQKFVITNTGSKNMPLAFGIHTCFCERDYLRLPIDARVDNGADSPLDGVAYPLDEREQLLAEGGKLEGEIDLGYRLCGHEIVLGCEESYCGPTEKPKRRYCLSNNFTHLTIWNADARSGFIAIEPQQGAANAFNNGCGLKVLKPGESEEYWTLITSE